MGKNSVQAEACLDKCYLDSVPSRKMVQKWFADFKLICTNTDDAERCRRPKEMVTPEYIKAVHKMVLAIRKVKLHDIAERY